MKNRLLQIAVLLVMFVLILCACGGEMETAVVETTVPTTPATEATEPEIEPDPAWLSEDAIGEACAYMFPAEGEINVEQAQEILLPLVEAGNAEAQYYWGYIYDWLIPDNNGDEEKESLYWYLLSAEQGFPKAYLAAYLNGYIEPEEQAEMLELAEQTGLFEKSPEELGADGCEMMGAYYYSKKNYTQAIEWYTQAADMGSTTAMYKLGVMYYYGDVVAKDIGAALNWLLKSANAGDVYAMYDYAYVFLENDYAEIAVNNRYAESFDEYLEAAENGDPVAMCNVAYMYDYGYGGISVDKNAALDWYIKAAELGDAVAMYSLGSRNLYSISIGYDGSVNFEGIDEQALEWLLKAAELGNYDAMNAIANMYNDGRGVEKDTEEANKWWSQASKASSKAKDSGVDSEYFNYYGDKRDIEDEAMKWFLKAKDAGYSPAYTAYGYFKYTIRNNTDVAKGYSELGAEAGHNVAMANLAYLYYKEGKYDSAMEWYMKAYANGYEAAAEHIQNMLAKQQGVNAYFEHYSLLISG